MDPSRVRVSGPLACFKSGFLSFLVAAGYGLSTRTKFLMAMNHVSRWLIERDLGPTELNSNRIREFVFYRRKRGHAIPGSLRGLELLVRFLRERGVLPP